MRFEVMAKWWAELHKWSFPQKQLSRGGSLMSSRPDGRCNPLIGLFLPFSHAWGHLQLIFMICLNHLSWLLTMQRGSVEVHQNRRALVIILSVTASSVWAQVRIWMTDKLRLLHKLTPAQHAHTNSTSHYLMTLTVICAVTLRLPHLSRRTCGSCSLLAEHSTPFSGSCSSPLNIVGHNPMKSEGEHHPHKCLWKHKCQCLTHCLN